MKTPPPTFHVYWGRITAAILGALTIGISPAFFTGEWRRALGGAAVIAAVIVGAWIGYRIGHANALAERAFQVEAARGTKSNDPDPFAEQLRDEPTYDLTHGAYNPDTPHTDRDGHAFYSGLDTFELTARLHNLGVPPHIAAAEAGEYVDSDGKQITWHPTATDTTGETR